MPDGIRKVDYFKIMVPNKRGEPAKTIFMDDLITYQGALKVRWTSFRKYRLPLSRFGHFPHLPQNEFALQCAQVCDE